MGQGLYERRITSVFFILSPVESSSLGAVSSVICHRSEILQSHVLISSVRTGIASLVIDCPLVSVHVTDRRVAAFNDFSTYQR